MVPFHVGGHVGSRRSACLFLLVGLSVFDLFIGTVSAQDTAAAAGLGEWILSYKTEQTTGDGCSGLNIDEEFRTGLVINANNAEACAKGSESCKYIFNWKCAAYNEFAQMPEKQDADVKINTAEGSASISIPTSSYRAFSGTWTVQRETFTVTDQALRGNESWTWTSDDGKSTCQGEDHIVGLLGSYDCSGEHDIIDDPIDPDAPVAPAPEGRWRLKSSTSAAFGEGCADMEIKVGFTVNSAVIISQVAEEDLDPTLPPGPQFNVFWKCSTDESLVEWEDVGTVRRLEGGNITLFINRTGASGDDGGGKKKGDGGGADGAEEAEIPQDGYEETRSVMRLTFCPVRGPGGSVDYKICHGRELWTWRYPDGRECTGWDKIRGLRGDCTDAMQTALEVVDADDELEAWLNAQYEEDEEGDLEELGPDLPPDAWNTADEGPVTKEGYHILDYTAPKSGAVGVLLVGVPIGTLALGLAATYLRRRFCAGGGARAGGRPDGYSLVNVGGDGEAPRV